jgi:hypothetical protein
MFQPVDRHPKAWLFHPVSLILAHCLEIVVSLRQRACGEKPVFWLSQQNTSSEFRVEKVTSFINYVLETLTMFIFTLCETVSDELCYKGQVLFLFSKTSISSHYRSW